MHYYEYASCYQCGDFLMWFMDQWYCPSCEKDIIERLKKAFVIIERRKK